jgi:DNA-binding NarL/FixJ family response regulator
MIVDDEAIVLLSLKKELQNSFGDEFAYETALSATEAGDLIEELEAEGVTIILIISDWLMPGIRGDEFLRRVHGRHPDIKTMIISGHADQAAIQRARDESALGAYLAKPWRTEDLVRAVKGLVG